MESTLHSPVLVGVRTTPRATTIVYWLVTALFCLQLGFTAWAQLRLPQVVKQDGSRTEFDREKLRTGFMRALHKRPVPTPLVDDAVNAVVQQTLALGEREIRSRRIGEMVMKELYKLDDVAYIRFASVYKSFQDVDDFQDAIKEVRKPPGKNK